MNNIGGTPKIPVSKPTPWEKFYEQTEGHQPWAHTIKSIELAPDKDLAIDIGAGALNESKYALEKGFKQVIAIDTSKKFVERAEQLASLDKRFEWHNIKASEFPMFPESISYVVATNSFSFMTKDEVKIVWQNIREGLKSGGILACTFFGVKDQFNMPEDGHTRTFYTREEINEFIKDYEVIENTELNGNTENVKSADGTKKRWHMFTLILRKK